jgi:hypothetical protein
MLATPNPVAEQSPPLAITLGAGLAGLLHVVKALFRPLVTVSTAGLGTPVVSAMEDAAAAGGVFVAIVAPALVIVLLALLFAALWWSINRWRRRRAARPF